jgi:hypothetical protein
MTVPPPKTEKKQRGRPRKKAKRGARPEVLDVYGTVTGSGVALSEDRIRQSVFAALKHS